MPDAIAIQAYFAQLDEGFQFMKMIELTKRRPNAWNIMETGQKIATQKLMFHQGQTAQQVATNPHVQLTEPNAFAVPGIQQPVNVTPQPVDPLAVLTDTINKLADKVDVLTSHSRRQHARLNRLEDDKPPVTV
jgi:hypothetical protein|tara:strand:- start:104 stop:502 length:399 start_codon:yes stop_codon:yes gene_type:complete